MQKGRDGKEDQIRAARRQLGLVSDCERVCFEGDLLIPSFPHRDLQAVTVHDLRPVARFVGILSEEANLDPRPRGNDSRQRLAAASGAADENANRLSHNVSQFPVPRGSHRFWRRYVIAITLSRNLKRRLATFLAKDIALNHALT